MNAFLFFLLVLCSILWMAVCYLAARLTDEPIDEDAGPAWDSNTRHVCQQCGAYCDGPARGRTVRDGLCIPCFKSAHTVPPAPQTDQAREIIST